MRLAMLLGLAVTLVGLSAQAVTLAEVKKGDKFKLHNVVYATISCLNAKTQTLGPDQGAYLSPHDEPGMIKVSELKALSREYQKSGYMGYFTGISFDSKEVNAHFRADCRTFI